MNKSQLTNAIYLILLCKSSTIHSWSGKYAMQIAIKSFQKKKK